MKKSLFRCLILVLPSIMLTYCSGDKTPGENIEVRYKPSTNFEADFLNPPDYARIRAFWWWLNSNVTEDGITKDLEAMKANGYGGAIIFDAGSSNYSVAHKTPAGPAFLSDNWLKLYQHAIREADRLPRTNHQCSERMESRWSFGHS